MMLVLDEVEEDVDNEVGEVDEEERVEGNGNDKRLRKLLELNKTGA